MAHIANAVQKLIDKAREQEREDERHHQEALLDKIWELVKDHGRVSGTVIEKLTFNWTQVGYDLRSNGYAVQYKEKPVKP